MFNSIPDYSDGWMRTFEYILNIMYIVGIRERYTAPATGEPPIVREETRRGYYIQILYVLRGSYIIYIHVHVCNNIS